MKAPTQKRDHDHDTFFKRPAAWKKAKEALSGHYDLDPLFARLEELAGDGSVRLLLTQALFQYVTSTRQEREAAFKEYYDWVESKPRRPLADVKRQAPKYEKPAKPAKPGQPWKAVPVDGPIYMPDGETSYAAVINHEARRVTVYRHTQPDRLLDIVAEVASAIEARHERGKGTRVVGNTSKPALVRNKRRRGAAVAGR